MRSEVQIHMMLPIAGKQTLRELFANQYEVLVHATVVCKPGFTPDALRAFYKAETFGAGRGGRLSRPCKRENSPMKSIYLVGLGEAVGRPAPRLKQPALGLF
jgi:hypothetical protein